MKKYKKGKQIKTLDELFSYEVVFVTAWDRAQSTAFFRSWPYFLIKNWMDTKRFYTSERIEPTEVEIQLCENCACAFSEPFKICPQCGAEQ